MSLLELARKELSEKIEHLVEDLAYGSAPDYAQYQRHCGLIQGYKEALDITERLIKLQEQDDDN